MKYGDRSVHGPTFPEFMPVSLLGAVMGLSRLCFAWRLASEAWHVIKLIGEIIGFAAILVFVLLAIVYTVKRTRYPASVESEFNNSVSVMRRPSGSAFEQNGVIFTLMDLTTFGKNKNRFG